MSSLPTLVRAIARKEIILMIRYPVNTFSNLLLTYLFFLLIFFGGQAVAGPALTESLDGIIVGFFLWTMSSLSFGYLAYSVSAEAQWGTLEQLYMTPFGIRTIMVVKAVVGTIINFGWGVVMLLLMLVTSGQTLQIDIVTVLSLGMLTLASALGIGFLFAGLALLYKRIEDLLSLVNFLIVGFIAVPVGSYSLLKALPLAQGSYLLRQTMEDGILVWELPAVELLILVATAVAYVGVGYYVFWWSQRRARRKGILGHY
ncbi:ABC transporter permease [Natronorubrum halophilum]|uniref:ABC transporter permease n=1 Tax=Natronorubrum halophilum TaxID=1702106 RepID=UPI000EF67FDB|nr:ABC transporter permease [Natronorubrum halophilum]